MEILSEVGMVNKLKKMLTAKCVTYDLKGKTLDELNLINSETKLIEIYGFDYAKKEYSAANESLNYEVFTRFEKDFNGTFKDNLLKLRDENGGTLNEGETLYATLELLVGGDSFKVNVLENDSLNGWDVREEDPSIKNLIGRIGSAYLRILRNSKERRSQ